MPINFQDNSYLILLVVFLGSLSFLVSLRKPIIEFWAFLIVLLVTEEINIEKYIRGEAFSSIYSFKFLGFNALEWLLLLTLAGWILNTIALRGKLVLVKGSIFDRQLTVFFVIVLLGFLNGIWHTYFFLNTGLFELKQFLYIFAGYFLTVQLINDRKKFDITFAVIIACICENLLLALYREIAGIGSSYGVILKSLLSGQQNISFILIGAWITWVVLKLENRKLKLGMSVFATGAVLMIILVVAKELYFYLAFIFLLLFWKVDLSHKARILRYSFMSLIAFAVFVSAVFPRWYTDTTFLMTSIFIPTYGGTQSGIIRWLEVRNIWANLINDYSMVQGEGIGVFWRVIYGFPPDPDHWAFPASDPLGLHHSSHLLALDLLWKFGLIGLTAYLYLLFSFFKRGLALYDALKDKYYKGVTIGLLAAGMPVLFLLGYYKLYLFAGVLIGMVAVEARLKNVSAIV